MWVVHVKVSGHLEWFLCRADGERKNIPIAPAHTVQNSYLKKSRFSFVIEMYSSFLKEIILNFELDFL